MKNSYHDYLKKLNAIKILCPDFDYLINEKGQISYYLQGESLKITERYINGKFGNLITFLLEDKLGD